MGALLSRWHTPSPERGDRAPRPLPWPLCPIRPRHVAHGRPRHNRAPQSASPNGRLPGRLLRAALMRGALAAGGYGHLRDRRAQDFPVAPRAYGPVSLARRVWLLYAVNRPYHSHTAEVRRKIRAHCGPLDAYMRPPDSPAYYAPPLRAPRRRPSPIWPRGAKLGKVLAIAARSWYGSNMGPRPAWARPPDPDTTPQRLARFYPGAEKENYLE